MLVRPLPGVVVGLTPQPTIVGGAGIGIKRHGIVGPDAVTLQLLAPRFDRRGVVRSARDQVGLHERDTLPCADQALGQFTRGHPTILVECRSSLFRQALDASLDGDAARLAEQIEHLGLPQIEPRLYAESQVASDQRLEERAIGQEYLVDEIEVADALAAQLVDFAHQGSEVAPAIAVAKIDLGAKAAGIRTAARRLDLGAEPV